MTASPPRPLVAVTRDERGDDSFSRALEDRGLRPLPLATVRFGAPQDPAPLEAALAALSEVDWILFTSATAVDVVCRHPAWERARRTGPLRARIGAVGRITADRVRSHGMDVDVTPEDDRGAGALAAVLARATHLKGQRVLWPRSDIARRELSDALAAQGAVVIDPIAYRTETGPPDGLPEFVDELHAGRVGAVAFMSPSSVQGLASVLPGGTLALLTGQTLVASLGPTTSAQIAASGGRVDIEAEHREVAALASAIAERLSPRDGDAP